MIGFQAGLWALKSPCKDGFGADNPLPVDCWSVESYTVTIRAIMIPAAPMCTALVLLLSHWILLPHLYNPLPSPLRSSSLTNSPLLTFSSSALRLLYQLYKNLKVSQLMHGVPLNFTSNTLICRPEITISSPPLAAVCCSAVRSSMVCCSIGPQLNGLLLNRKFSQLIHSVPL
jgi:hypothetical protein